MLKLYGFAASNYYNVIKAALLEKGVAFEEINTRQSKDASFKAISPMRKVPALATEQGGFCETQVMLDYLEEAAPEPRLYPQDAFARAKVRELMRVIELYLELPARRLYYEAFFGGSVSDETKAEVRPALGKGVKALGEIASFSPYIAGDTFTYADIAAVIHLPLVRDAGRKIYDEDVLTPLGDLRDYLRMIRGRPSMQRVLADQKADLEAFLKNPAGA